ncbi:MAG: hypothetical protein ACK5NK_01560 [Niabella sp.]
MKFIFLLFILPIVLLISCGTQQRLSQVQQIVDVAQKDVASSKAQLDSVTQKVQIKLSSGEMDDSVKRDFNNALTKLNDRLKDIENKVVALEGFLKSKSNFNNRNYETNIKGVAAAVDSFNILKHEREKVYSLITAAINIKAFNLYDMAAFFEPGVYNIPATAVPLIYKYFNPAIDSIAVFANQYDSIPLLTRLVFVGYADESPIAAGGELYNNLARFSTQPMPTSDELNRVLSMLRANEMLRNMKMVLRESAGKFTDYSTIKFNYTGYGRGIAYPNPKITDYKKDDERRRIVMFYWSVLPNL